jgi:DNA-binding transcriptional regulator LsrR (DeoR family)
VTPADRTGTPLTSHVARLFFDRQLSKVEIATRLGISRFRVARLIDEALTDGLVRIEFRDVPADDRALARAIEERYGLDLCAVAAGDAAEPTDAARGASAGTGTASSEPTDRVARLAASVIDGLLAPDDVVGIAWGSTLAAVVRAIGVRRDPSLAVVQLAGSSMRLDRDRDPGELARLLADRLGATHHPLYAPAFVDSADLREALLRQPDLAATTAMFERLTLAIVGIGAIGPAPDPAGSASGSSLVRSGVLGPEEIDRLRALARDGSSCRISQIGRWRSRSSGSAPCVGSLRSPVEPPRAPRSAPRSRRGSSGSS